MKNNIINNEINKYFNILCNNDYPKFINKYIDTNELQRLKGIGQFCGCDYTKIHNVKYWFSRLDHSIATALMTWNFTKNKTQTICALFHDLGTPAFSHCIDYLLNDTINQESSEKNIFDIINYSQQIKDYLIEDNVSIEDIKDISKYPIVENKKPKICVDRLEGILGTCLIWTQYWNLDTIKSIYEDIIILKNEENEDEIGFKSLKTCEIFFEGVYKYSIVLQQNEDKFTMQFITECLKGLIDNKKIIFEQLYQLSEQDIISIIKETYKENWQKFENATKIERTDNVIEGTYLVSLDSKKRYVVPLCQNNEKISRLNDVSDQCNKLLQAYLNYNDIKYSYILDLKIDM